MEGHDGQGPAFLCSPEIEGWEEELGTKNQKIETLKVRKIIFLLRPYTIIKANNKEKHHRIKCTGLTTSKNKKLIRKDHKTENKNTIIIENRHQQYKSKGRQPRRTCPMTQTNTRMAVTNETLPKKETHPERFIDKQTQGRTTNKHTHRRAHLHLVPLHLHIFIYKLTCLQISIYKFTSFTHSHAYMFTFTFAHVTGPKHRRPSS